MTPVSANGGVLTWANGLTLIRLLLCFPVYLCIQHQRWLLCAAYLTAAVITDVCDGKLARKLQQASPLGGFFDHATDALLVSVSCFALANLGMINPWLAALIVAAFLQYSIDSRLLSDHSLRSSTLGRINGIAYFVLVCTAAGSQLLSWVWLQDLVSIFAWLLVASTLVSMADRLQASIRLQRKPGP